MDDPVERSVGCLLTSGTLLGLKTILGVDTTMENLGREVGIWIGYHFTLAKKTCPRFAAVTLLACVFQLEVSACQVRFARIQGPPMVSDWYGWDVNCGDGVVLRSSHEDREGAPRLSWTSKHGRKS